MHRKIVALWISLIIMVSSIVILVEIAQRVEAPMTLYVGGGGGGNYTKIQWAIDNASDGDTVYVYNGTYYENVIVNKSINLTGEDKNTTIVDGGGFGDVVIVSINWTNITGFKISNSSVWNFGIILSQVSHCMIVNNNIMNDDGGLYLTNASNNHVVSNNISNNVWMGMELASGSNSNIIIGNTVMNSTNGVFINSGSDLNIFSNNSISLCNGAGLGVVLSSNNTISNNEVYSNEMTGVYLQSSPYNIIEFNNISNNQNHGIQTAFSSYNIIRGNKIGHNKFDGIKLAFPPLNNCTIENNSIFFNEENGLELSSPIDCIIQYNEIRNNTKEGITLSRSINNKICENNISGNKRAIYFHTSPSFNNTISRNKVFENMDGVKLDDTSNNNITNNEIFLNTGGSLVLTTYKTNITNNQIYSNQDGVLNYGTSNSTFYNNLIYNNSFQSFYFYQSVNNTAFGNTIWNNYYGLYLRDSNNNTIHHNNIVNNSIQAWLMDSPDNVWDDGAGEGNFWSDYTGVDDGSGGRPKGDGVGDTQIPHPFIDQGDGYFQLDNYPLIDSIGEYLFLYPGWNLISIPKIQTNEDLSSVLFSITNYYDAVQWYNNTEIFDQWKHYYIRKDSKYNDLDSINHKIGFWIHITESAGVLFGYGGTQFILNQTIQLHKGWNMVGYPSLTSHNRTIGLNNLTFDTHVDCIQWYDAATQTWHFMDSSDNFVPGRGYWVHSKVEAKWEVPL